MATEMPIAATEHTPDVCKARGFHGPFINLDRYEAVPGWSGYGDCAICGSTCRTGPPPPAVEALLKA